MGKQSEAQRFEQLGSFYLGKVIDPDTGELRSEPLLYDARDLTTHAVCFGMTGSGKTGLCIGLLEEAAIDGIPSIVIDPKGDMANLALRFPQLRAKDFEPWVDEATATRRGMTRTEFAQSEAQKWRTGLAEWGQDAKRIKRFVDGARVRIFTPGGDAGLPVSVLRSFAAPSRAVREDHESFQESIQHAVAALLGLLGMDADPVKSCETVFLSTLFRERWQAGIDLSLAELIRLVEKPPFEKIGVVDVDSFFAPRERRKLAMSINGLLASPSFSLWTQGEPLKVPELLASVDGHPQISVFSIAHLSERERMFFVTHLLGEVLRWVRSQSGTSALRAILYMDEIAGYFPPSKEPSSKAPMLTLLKQARAYGLGVVLATQNPVDLDYKGLSNAGTWLIGRLSTTQDQARILDGLSRATEIEGWSKEELRSTLSSLSSRRFLLNNVHDSKPVVFQTRWALSYLRGPVTSREIRALCKGAKRTLPARGASKKKARGLSAGGAERPLVPAEVTEEFVIPTLLPAGAAQLRYKAVLAASADLRFVDSKRSIDHWRKLFVEVPLSDESPGLHLEDLAARAEDSPVSSSPPDVAATFDALGAAALRSKSYATWQKLVVQEVYRSQHLSLYKAGRLKLYSELDESLPEFRLRVKEQADTRRDRAVAKVKHRYQSKLQKAQERIRKAQARVGKEEEQYKAERNGAWLSVGANLLGALLGRKMVSSTNVRRAGSAVRSVGRVSTQRGDIARAQATLDAEREKLAILEDEFADALQVQQEKHALEDVQIDQKKLRPRKSDLSLGHVRLRWVPFLRHDDGRMERAG